jgi:MoxR-like ATPase
MDRTHLTVTLSVMPEVRVIAAFKQYNSAPWLTVTKEEAIEWLVDSMVSGRISATVDDIKALPINYPSIKQAVDNRQADTAAAAAGALASKAHDAAVDALEKADKLAAELSASKAQVTRLAKQVSDMSSVDTDSVKVAVAAAVAAEFAPFKQAVVAAGAQAVVGSMSDVRCEDFKTALEVFGVDVRDTKGKQMTVSIWNDPSAPAVDPDFIWTEGILKHLLLSDRTGENVWFGGEKGTGKSETARQFAARTGRGYVRINFHKHTSAEEYLGATGLKNGETIFEPRDFLMAYTSPSTVILLDEVTNADAGELAPLNGFLEPMAAVSFGGREWARAAGVLVFAADNTFGSGDDTGRYTGTRQQNVALVDRFSRLVPFTFLPQAQEIEAICKRTGCNRDVAEHTHAAIRVARQRVADGDIIDAPSIRSVMAFIRALSVLDVNEAWETAIVSRQPSESHAMLRGIYVSQINPSYLLDNL